MKFLFKAVPHLQLIVCFLLGFHSTLLWELLAVSTLPFNFYELVLLDYCMPLKGGYYVLFNTVL